MEQNLIQAKFVVDCAYGYLNAVKNGIPSIKNLVNAAYWKEYNPLSAALLKKRWSIAELLITKRVYVFATHMLEVGAAPASVKELLLDTCTTYNFKPVAFNIFQHYDKYLNKFIEHAKTNHDVFNGIEPTEEVAKKMYELYPCGGTLQYLRSLDYNHVADLFKNKDWAALAEIMHLFKGDENTNLIIAKNIGDIPIKYFKAIIKYIPHGPLDDTGLTLVHYAAIFGNENQLDILKELNFMLDAKSNAGHQPCDLGNAEWFYNARVVRVSNGDTLIIDFNGKKYKMRF